MIAMAAITFAVTLMGCTGKDGAPGATGPAGNANIETSYFTANSWILNGSYWYCDDFNVSPGTNDAVLVYLNSGSAYAALPLTVQDNEIYFSTHPGYVEMGVTSASGNTSISNPGTVSFKVVDIPQAVIKSHPNTNWKDYAQVKAIMDAQHTNQK